MSGEEKLDLILSRLDEISANYRDASFEHRRTRMALRHSLNGAVLVLSALILALGLVIS